MKRAGEEIVAADKLEVSEGDDVVSEDSDDLLTLGPDGRREVAFAIESRSTRRSMAEEGKWEG